MIMLSVRREVDAIVAIAADVSGLSEAQIRGRSRSFAGNVRQLVMWVAVRKTGAPLARIGRALDRDHSTVIHGVAAIEAKCSADPALMALRAEIWRRVDASELPPSLQRAACRLRFLRKSCRRRAAKVCAAAMAVRSREAKARQWAETQKQGATAARVGSLPTAIFNDRVTTYAELSAMNAAFCAAMIAAGYQPQEKAHG